MKFVYVILHYYTIDDTIKCVESILEKEKNNNYDIVIVDNNSPNKTGLELKNKYNNNNKIHVILNETNSGFSKGNNIGFKMAKNDLKADFIILLNNDTYLLQDNFSLLITSYYNECKFAVMGPKIYTKDSICGPLFEVPYTKESLKKEIKKLKIKLLFMYFNIRLRKFWKKEKIAQKDYNEILEQKVLHGCFWIFSPIYVKEFDGLDEKTDFYGEEIILYNKMKKHDMKMIFNPNLEVFHNEFSATNKMAKSNRKREINRMKKLIKAFNIIVKDWNNED